MTISKDENLTGDDFLVFSATYSSPIKLYGSKYIPSGVCIFANDSELDRVVNWLNEAEKMRAEIEQLKKKIADMEYDIFTKESLGKQ